MNNDDKRFLIRTMVEIRDLAKELHNFTSEMQEFKGKMEEFKENFNKRVEKLEEKEGERSKERLSVFSILVAFASLLVTFFFNFFRIGGR